MIRMIQSSSAGHAKRYFDEALEKSDYYLDDQERQGYFRGRIARRLGVEGPVTKVAFHALAENLNPITGEKLTPRTKDNRTVGYDINFHAPKSVSIVHALTDDDHIASAFQRAVHDTMCEIEKDAKSRVRKGGKDENRATRELIWGEFLHQTARPTKDAVPDPHLHIHAYVFNVTWDETEQRYKAGQFRDIKADMPFYQEQFLKRLSDNLVDAGYSIRKTEKAFEIEGVPEKTIRMFSKRTDEIGRTAKAKGITDPKEKDKLGAMTRGRKQKSLSMQELKRHWREQIKEAGIEGDGDNVIRRLKAKERATHQEKQPETAYAKPVEEPADFPIEAPKDCIDYAVLHCFERASVVTERSLLKTAYKKAIGHKGISVEAITEAFRKDKRIIRVQERRGEMCTTKEVLAEEKEMVALANSGKGKMRPLYMKAPLLTVVGQQRKAVEHVLTTTDQVSIIRGGAGTGKTTLSKEAIHYVRKSGKDVVIVAPTSDAARGTLRSEGFTDADTVARLLVDKKMQEKLTNNMLWVDEAGLLGTKDMSALLKLTKKHNARMVLLGDTRQHRSVVRGDALRILNTVANIKSADVNVIYRQRREQYKKAVQHLADGKASDAFSQLAEMNAIKSITGDQPDGGLVNDYIDAVKRKKSTLIIAPTHNEGKAITETLRAAMKKEKMIGKKETVVPSYVNLNMTEAEKSDWKSYEKGQVIQFDQNVERIKRGTSWKVKSVRESSVEIERDGEAATLPLNRAAHFNVYDETEIGIAKGDKIRITKNGFDVKDRRLNNGALLNVVRVNKSGTIRVRNPQSKIEYSLPIDYANIAHAHVVTSHFAQGKTVDEVFIWQPAATFPATDMKQFYVSVSRGRDNVHIYTDELDELQDQASRQRERQSALELVGKKAKNIAERKARDEMNREQSNARTENKTRETQEPIKRKHGRTIEPGL